MISSSNISGWGCGVDCPPAGKAYKTICEAMTQDPDIVKFYFVPFWHELGCG